MYVRLDWRQQHLSQESFGFYLQTTEVCLNTRSDNDNMAGKGLCSAAGRKHIFNEE